MKDHEKRELVTRLCAVARDYHPTEQLRDRIADLVLPALESVERYMTHEGGAVVAEVAQRFAAEAEGLRMQVQALELAYSQCMARQAQRAIDWGAVDDELRESLNMICATDAWNRKGAEDKLRALLRKVSGQ
jgi:hypothetical protein